MTLRRWEPTLLADWGREVDRMFDSVFGSGSTPTRFGTSPALNVWEDETGLVAEAEVPGYRIEDLEITVVANRLTLKGQRESTSEKEGDEESAAPRHHLRERSFGSFSRTVTLPFQVDGDKVTAELRDGILTVTLPRAESEMPRRIEVSTR